MLLVASKNSTLYNLPIGRATFALRDVHQRALDLGRDDIAEVVDIALGDARWAMQLAMSFRAGYTSLYPPAAVKMDGVVDHTVVGFEGYLQVQVRLYRGQPRGDAAERLLKMFFPNGVAAVTRLPFTEEHAQIEAILERARAEELADDVALLPELPEMLQLLGERNREYGEILSGTTRPPTRAEVREARERCQERVAEIVFWIIAHYGLREPDKTEERDHLLEPIMRQNEATGLSRKRRRNPTDVDPDTGEDVGGQPDLDDEDEASDEPADDVTDELAEDAGDEPADDDAAAADVAVASAVSS